MLKSMFLVENNVPDVYINESRDFQLVSRLYDLVFQSTRFSIDSMDYISDTEHCNDKLLSVLGSKVGFFSNLDISDATYRKVIAAFPYIMRYKGSKEGVQLILNLFMHITNSKLAMGYSEDPSVLVVIFYDYMFHVELLKELLEYVRPTGVMIKYEFKTQIKTSASYVMSDSVHISNVMHYIDLDESELSGVVVRSSNPESSDNYNSNIANGVGYTVTSKVNDTELET